MRKSLVCAAAIDLLLVGAAWSADVTVGKSGAPYTTVQAGINAARVGGPGTVTIIDSETYVEDVTIDIGAGDAGVTVQAAPGQQPTIRAANTSLRTIYGNPPVQILSPDRLGVSVNAPATLIGLTIENLDGATNVSTAFGDLAAAALTIHGSGVTVRDCTIRGPTSGFGPGNWTSVLVIAYGSEAAEVTLENCEISGGAYGLVNQTFGRYIPTFTVSSTTANNCRIHDAATGNVESDAGDLTLSTCTITAGQGHGVICGGGSMALVGCDILDSNNAGLYPDYNDVFALPSDWPVVTASDCLILRTRGSSRNASIRIDDGTLTLDHSIVGQPQNTAAIYLDDNNAASPCVLTMDFCDIFAPGQDCYWSDQDVKEHPIQLTITNSILVGVNGIVNTDGVFNPMSVSNSSIFVTGVATQGVTETNVVHIEPHYLLPYSGTRPGFRYTNTDLGIGPGGTEIGSQGRYESPGPLRARSWSLYD